MAQSSRGFNPSWRGRCGRAAQVTVTGSRGRNGRCGVTFQGILQWPSFSSQVPEFLQPLKKGPPAGNQMLNARPCGDGSYLSWYFISGLFVCQPDKNWGCLGRDRIWTEKKCPLQMCLQAGVGLFFLLLTDVGGSSPLWAVPSLDRWSWVC